MTAPPWSAGCRGLALAARLSTFAFALVAAACGGPVPSEQIYDLSHAPVGAAPGSSAGNDVAARPPLDGVLLVNPLVAEGVIGARRIAWRDMAEPLRLRLLDGHLWSAPPPLMLQERLLRCLDEGGAAGNVVPPGVPASIDFVLDGRIEVFEAQLESGRGAVAVETELFLTSRAGRALLWQRRFAYLEPIGALSAQGAVAGFARVLQRLCDDLKGQITAAP